MRSKRIQLLHPVILTLMIASSSSRAGSELLPVPSGMEGHVAFWESVFTVYSTDQIIFHDSDYPDRIYSVLKVDRKASGSKAIQAQIRQERNRIQVILQRLSRNPDPISPSEEVQSIRNLFGNPCSAGDFRRAAACIRIQGGMRESFQAGLERYGRYQEEMRRIFREENVPEDLVFLPHVESSFNPLARSKAGAAGIWQFTSKTGKRYLSIRPPVDERRDPLISTRAAAKLLRSNYEILKSWPLAITAYNHGTGGMKRAVRKTGSRDLGQIIRTYQSKRFGFASQNFYAEFLAARQISMNAEQYFHGIYYDPPFRVQSLALTHPFLFSQWAAETAWPNDVLAEINPALSSEILLDQVPIPAHTKLNVPIDEKAGQLIALAVGTSIYWASNAPDALEAPSVSFSSTVAYSVKTEVNMGDPVQKDPILEKRFTDSSNSKSVRNLTASADPEIHVEMASAPEPEEEVERSPVLPDLPNFELNLAIQNGDRITVLPEETLGHYADWLEIPTGQLRRLNRLRYGQNIQIGQTVRLLFDKISEEAFQARREKYHQGIRQHFFLTHQIDEVRSHVIRSGESFWTVANDSDNVPLWLMLAYNNGNPVNRLKPGDRLCVPVVTQKQNTG